MWTGIGISQSPDPKKSLGSRFRPPQGPPGAAVPAAAPGAAEPIRVAQVAPLSTPLAAINTGAEPRALAAQPTTLQIALPQEVRPRITALATGASPATLVLRIDGVEIPADRGAVVQVFLNRPDVTAPARGPQPRYVGSIII